MWIKYEKIPPNCKNIVKEHKTSLKKKRGEMEIIYSVILIRMMNNQQGTS